MPAMNSRRPIRWPLVAAILLLSTVAHADALHQAARSGATRSVRMLLRQGADVNAVDRYGFTPLLLARINGHGATAHVLTRHGGKTNLSALVHSLQARLNYLGYAAGPLDGHLGPQTRQAIRKFQHKLGVAPSGHIGEHWVAALQKQVVERVQQQLKQQRVYRGGTNGRLGSATVAAIRRYQKANRLAQTGALSAQLLQSLAAGPSVSRALRGNPNTLSNHDLIKATQYELNRMGYAAGPVDGHLGPQTVAAIRTFQHQQGLPPTGKPSPRLLKRLRATGPNQASSPPDRGRDLTRRNTEVRGILRLERGAGHQLLGCTIEHIQLDQSWCQPFINSPPARLRDCRAIIRNDGQVLMVKCQG